MKTKAKTQRAKLEDQQAANRALLMKLMSLTADDMFRLISDYGLQYLGEQCRHDQAGIDTLSGEAFYWNWWKQNWQQRDAEFIALHELQNGELTDTEFEFWIDEFGELQTMTLYGAYRYYHLQAMSCDHLDKSYCHIMTATQAIWRKRIFNQQSI